MCVVNCTREPVIETILSPRDGYKLSVKNSKIHDAEEWIIDAVEVVSFGHAVFFRGQEGPRPFLVPVTDYEIVEVKEVRTALKNASYERNIKIGGGRDAFVKPSKDGEEEEDKNDRRKDRKKHRRNKRDEHRDEEPVVESKEETITEVPIEEGLIEESVVEKNEEEIKTPSSFAHLLPPPPMLISENLAKMRKEQETQKDVTEELPVVQEVEDTQEGLPF